VNAIDGANADARGVLRSNARFRDRISHAEAPWARVEKPVSFLILPRRSRRVQPPSRRGCTTRFWRYSGFAIEQIFLDFILTAY